jgi:hypothetical protein
VPLPRGCAREWRNRGDLLDGHAAAEAADGSSELGLDVDGERAEVTLHVGPEHLDAIQRAAFACGARRARSCACMRNSNVSPARSDS